MIDAIRLRPALSCCVVWSAADGGLQPNSTTGGRDKRPGALGRYGFVVAGFFTCFAQRHSAATASNALSPYRFCRAVPAPDGPRA